MKALLKLEELAQFLFGIFLFSLLDYSWWWFPALILLPDLGMIGYAFNSKIGASVYNLFHHKGIAIGILIGGWIFDHSLIMLIGIILFAHTALDRIFGYGLKYSDRFQNTHLGRIGQKEK